MPGHGSVVTAPVYIGICPDKLLHRWATAWDAIQINALLLQLRIVTPVANVGSPLLTLHVSWVAPFPALYWWFPIVGRAYAWLFPLLPWTLAKQIVPCAGLLL